MNQNKQSLWFAKNKEHVLEELHVDPVKGLTRQDVKKRQDEFGKNELTGSKKESRLLRFIRQPPPSR